MINQTASHTWGKYFEIEKKKNKTAHPCVLYTPQVKVTNTYTKMQT